MGKIEVGLGLVEVLHPLESGNQFLISRIHVLLDELQEEVDREKRSDSSNSSSSSRDRRSKSKVTHHRSRSRGRSKHRKRSDSDSSSSSCDRSHRRARGRKTRSRSRYRSSESSYDSESSSGEGNKSLKVQLKFDGKGNWVAFFNKFKKFAKSHKWSCRTAKNQLCYALEGPPSEYYAVLEEQDPHITYKEIVSKLANRYGRKDLDENMKEKFRGMKQEMGEDLDEWAERVLQVATKAHRDASEKYMMREAAMKVCVGCIDKVAATYACDMKPKTVEEAVHAIKWKQHTTSSIHGSVYTRPMHTELSGKSQSTSQSSDTTVSPAPPVQNSNREPVGGERRGPIRRPYLPRTCYHCESPDHFIRNCPFLHKERSKCSNCGSSDHLSSNCTKPKPKTSEGKQKDQNLNGKGVGSKA